MISLASGVALWGVGCNEEDVEPEENVVPVKIDTTCETGGTGFIDASYFVDGGSLRVGCGLDINDPLSAKKNCFTEETSSENLAVRQGNALDTKVEVYYTKNDYEYNTLRSSNFTGKVGFMSVFDMDAKRLEELTQASSASNERLVFVASVDFGDYYFAKDPVLTKEAKGYIDRGSFAEFKTLYGSHYVSGFHKRNSFVVVLERKANSEGFSVGENSSLDMSFDITKASGSYGFTETNKEEVNKNFIDAEVNIEKYGSSLSPDVNAQIEMLVKQGNLLDAVKGFLSDELESLKDESQAKISGWYISPFVLYGCGKINWSAEKVRTLEIINANYLSLKRFVNVVKRYEKGNALDIEAGDEIEDLGNRTLGQYLVESTKEGSSYELSEEFIARIDSVYRLANMQDEFRNLDDRAKEMCVELKRQYHLCANLETKMAETEVCDYSAQMEVLFEDFDSKYHRVEQIEKSLWVVYFEGLVDAYQKEEEQKVSFVIENSYSNPYKIEKMSGPDSSEFPFVLEGKGRKEVKLLPGSYTFRATQQSGYLLYATVVTKTFEVKDSGGVFCCCGVIG